MKVPLAVVADSANVSKEGKLNILGIFDRITVHAVPATHPHLTMVLTLEASAAETGRTHSVEIICMDADGGRLFGLKGDVNIKTKDGTARVNQVMNLQNIAFRKLGEHSFSILVNNEIKYQIPLTIVKVSE